MSAESLPGVVFAALVFAAVGTPVASRTAFRFGIVDQPAPRKLHTRPVPLLGGVALVLAVLGALLIVPGRRTLVELAGILGGATWVSFWGLWDDRRALSPSWKIAAQLVAAAALLWGGVRVQLALPEVLNVALTLLWIVGITNAFNLLDNMDGLAGGVGAVAAAMFLLLAALNGQYLVGALAAAVLGACLGFLPHNLNPARIFMGDSGSLFLGFVLAAVGLKVRFPASHSWITWMVPVLVMGVAIIDTSFVVVDRLRAGRNPFTSPGRDHLSHRLAERGWGCRAAVGILCGTGVFLGAAAVAVSFLGPAAAYSTGGVAALVATAVLLRLALSPRPAAATFPGTVQEE